MMAKSPQALKKLRLIRDQQNEIAALREFKKAFDSEKEIEETQLVMELQQKIYNPDTID